jgi:hypothetical protein
MGGANLIVNHPDDAAERQIATAAQVPGAERFGTGWILAINAESRGAIARTTSVLATVVRMSAIMKQVNMIAQQSPESQRTPPLRKNGRHQPPGSRPTSAQTHKGQAGS